ncbi:SigE family RNA polymerase sigma factor [Knoellia sp. S7-12]|uniref:SigE family RNA polymerase sigma factor n=1 Tax=Knoellia sp. S7-12 TaxID=3126698 RepID=UPI0033693790
MTTFEDFVASRGPTLLRLAVMLTGNSHDAEDLLQATFIKVIRHWGRVADAGNPEAYTRKILVNEHLSWRRRPQRRESAVAELESPPLSDPTIHVSARDAAWQLLNTLPPRQRAVLALRYYSDLSDDQIAATLGCTASTVRSNASRALTALRENYPALDPEATP